MTVRRRTLMLVAGEASGDLHGALLATALQAQCPGLTLWGLGGDRMQAAGVDLRYPLARHLAVVGLVEVLRHLGRFWTLYRTCLTWLDRTPPDAIILIDYPGFNLRLAQAAHERGIPVIYFISPQVWAWGWRRVHAMKRIVDLLLVILPFEESVFRGTGLAVQWVGHPLLDVVAPTQAPDHFLTTQGLDPHAPTITLLPGSRRPEVTRHLPLMLRAARLIADARPGTQFLIGWAPTLSLTLCRDLIHAAGVRATVVQGQIYDCIHAATFVMTSSGTATLETALLERPMAIIYQVSPMTWWIGRRLVKLPYIGLANVIAGRQIVPEFLQREATPERLARETVALLETPERLAAMRTALREIRQRLGPPGAAGRAAASVLKMLEARGPGQEPKGVTT